MATMFHEFGHILNGHLRIKSSMRAVLVDGESHIAEKDNISRDRVLEFDADAFSAQNMIRFFHQRPRKVIEEYCSNFDDDLRIAIIIPAIVFTYFGRRSSYDPNWIESDRTHPHPFHRFLLSLDVADAVLNENNPDKSSEDRTGLISPLTLCALKSMTLILGQSFVSSAADIADFDPVHKRLCNILQNGWADIHDELDQAKYHPFKLAPPSRPIT